MYRVCSHIKHTWMWWCENVLLRRRFTEIYLLLDSWFDFYPHLTFQKISNSKMGKIFFPTFVIFASITLCLAGTRIGRSIDLSAAHSLISDSRLPGEITPNNYTIDLRPNMEESTFTGKIKMVLTVQEPTNQITMHASHDLEVAETDIKLTKIGMDEK